MCILSVLPSSCWMCQQDRMLREYFSVGVWIRSLDTWHSVAGVFQTFSVLTVVVVLPSVHRELSASACLERWGLLSIQNALERTQQGTEKSSHRGHTENHPLTRLTHTNLSIYYQRVHHYLWACVKRLQIKCSSALRTRRKQQGLEWTRVKSKATFKKRAHVSQRRSEHWTKLSTKLCNCAQSWPWTWLMSVFKAEEHFTHLFHETGIEAKWFFKKKNQYLSNVILKILP